MKTKVINFFGAPGSGKSTHAAKLFAHMKEKGINCELVMEYAKAVTWRKAQPILGDQLYVFAKQHNYQHRLMGQVEYIITDSPLLMSLFYGADEGVAFHDVVRVKWDTFDNINFYVSRNKAYNPAGRNQTEKESDDIAGCMIDILVMEHVKVNAINSDTPVEDIYRTVIGLPVTNHGYYYPGMGK